MLHIGLPISTPVSHARDELRLGQPRTSRSEHVLLASLFGPNTVPGHPAAREIALQNATHRHLLGVLDAFLLLALELLLHLTLQLCLLPPPLTHLSAKLLELSVCRVKSDLHLLPLLHLLLIAFCERHLRSGMVFGLPHSLPSLKASNEFRAKHLVASRFQCTLKSQTLLVSILPRHPAFGQLALGKASDGHLLRVLDALFLLLRECIAHLALFLLELMRHGARLPLLLEPLLFHGLHAELHLVLFLLEGNPCFLHRSLGFSLSVRSAIPLGLQLGLELVLLLRKA